MLSVKQGVKTFKNGAGEYIHALNGIDLDVEDGEFVIIVGTNGSGKSTLMNVIAGSDLLDAGTVHLDGRNITGEAAHVRARKIGRVFQDPAKGTLPDLTVLENLALAAHRRHRISLRPAVDAHFRDECLQRLTALGVGLEHRLNQRMATLSGGQRQILTLLMATWHRPALLLLDEHTAALDPKGADIVMRMTDRIVAEQNISAVMVTHSMKQAARSGDRLIVMHRGNIVRDIRGTEKRRLRARELDEEFETIRRIDLIDESVGTLLREQYV